MSLQSTKADLAAQLAATGYPVMDTAPENLTPPKVVLTPGDPYVTPTDTWVTDEAVVHLDIVLVAKTSLNKQMSSDLDQMIQAVMLNLDDWTVENVSQPLYQVINNSYRLYTIVTVSHEFQMES